MKYTLTVFICKLISGILKLLGKNATSFPGHLAMKICPDIGKVFSSKVKKDIVAVMGTNGKTTTNNLLCDYYEEAGAKTVCNRLGANMPEGIITSFIEKCSVFGKLDVSFACLEMDEAWSNKIMDYIVPTKIVITNLFRDQLDRYGEIEGTMEYLRKAIKKAPKATLILNADDPLIVATAEIFDNEKVYFGIKDKFKEYKAKIKDGQHCYRCHKNLGYNFYHFGHIGDYFCECGFKRPELDFYAENISVYPNVSFNNNKIGEISLNGRGLYNIYNILSSGCTAYLSGISGDFIKNCAKKYTPQIGRLEEFNINGKKVYLILAKNPAGFNQSVATVNEDPSEKDIVIAINDNAQDGKDVSWLWDVDFEDMFVPEIKSFLNLGTRHLDMSLRLKYAGVEDSLVTASADTETALLNVLKNGKGESVYVLSNYTAIFKIRKALKDIEKVFAERK